MAKKSEKETRYCPFKKAISTEYNGNNSKKEIHERFEQCAGDRCMAYIPYHNKCARIEN